MSDENYTQNEFLAKMEWEGSIEDALEYGLTASSLDPEHVEPYFIRDVSILEDIWKRWKVERDYFIAQWGEEYNL